MRPISGRSNWLAAGWPLRVAVLAMLGLAVAVLVRRVLPPVPKWKDVAYAQVSPAQKLDVYLPRGEGPFPAVIYVHGGGWNMGDKALPPRVVQPYSQVLDHGYGLVSVNYRLSTEAPFPAQIQDVKAAVRFLRAHSDAYGLDPDRFAAWGDSAGAHLAVLLGTSAGVGELEGAWLGNPDQSSRVQAVVDWYGPMDFLQMDPQALANGCQISEDNAQSRPDSLTSRLIGAPIIDRPDLVLAANPVRYVSSEAPPFLIEHGTKDCNVAPQQSQMLYEALAEAVGPERVTLIYLTETGHGGPPFLSAANLRAVWEFLDKYLRN